MRIHHVKSLTPFLLFSSPSPSLCLALRTTCCRDFSNPSWTGSNLVCSVKSLTSFIKSSQSQSPSLGIALATTFSSRHFSSSSPNINTTSGNSNSNRPENTASCSYTSLGDWGLKNLGLHVVPLNVAHVVERVGEFHKVLKTGIHLLNPFLDEVAYVHDMKGHEISIPELPIITKDNITYCIACSLEVKVIDPYLASYKANKDPTSDFIRLAHEALQSEYGKIGSDQFFKFKRTEKLGKDILDLISEEAASWGYECSCLALKQMWPFKLPDATFKFVSNDIKRLLSDEQGVLLTEEEVNKLSTLMFKQIDDLIACLDKKLDAAIASMDEEDHEILRRDGKDTEDLRKHFAEEAKELRSRVKEADKAIRKRAVVKTRDTKA